MLDQCDVIARAYVRWRRPASARGVVCSRSRRRRRARPYPVGPCRRGRRRRVRVRVRAAHGRGHETEARAAPRVRTATCRARRVTCRPRAVAPHVAVAAALALHVRRGELAKGNDPDLPGRRRRHARRAARLLPLPLARAARAASWTPAGGETGCAKCSLARCWMERGFGWDGDRFVRWRAGVAVCALAPGVACGGHLGGEDAMVSSRRYPYGIPRDILRKTKRIQFGAR